MIKIVDLFNHRVYNYNEGQGKSKTFSMEMNLWNIRIITKY